MKGTAFALAAFLCCACSSPKLNLLPVSNFEKEIDGKTVSLYTIKGGDITAQITNYGARVVSIWAPDSKGTYADIEVGNSDLEGYLNNNGDRFFGAVVGPVGNRIKNGTFTLDGEEYHTPLNEREVTTLHGGFNGLDKVVWDVREATESSITMTVLHADGQEGFPGNKQITVTYSIDSGNGLDVRFKATTDKATPINLCWHPFFNLSGDSSRSTEGYLLQIFADAVTPTDGLLIPTGEILPVEGNAFDFRTVHAIGDMSTEPELEFGGGYDNNWVLARTSEDGMEPAMKLLDPESGRGIEIYTDQKGLQFYGGNGFDGSAADKYGNMIVQYGAVVFEAQNFPDAINNPGFPDSVLLPGEVYSNNARFVFTCSKQ